MENILEKLSSYNILNNILPGVVFIFFWDKSFPTMKFALSEDNLISSIFLYYFFGMIISRAGSLFIEPAFKFVKIIRFEPYSRYLQARCIDEKIPELLETDNLFRTMIATFLFLLIIRVAHSFIFYPGYILYKDIFMYIFLIFTIIFSLAYRKQTQYIVKRINTALETKEKP